MCNRILWEARKSGEEMLQILENAYGTEAMIRPRVSWWWKHFKDENKRVVDYAQSQRPITAVTDVNTD
jgi:hypothetical protein